MSTECRIYFIGQTPSPLFKKRPRGREGGVKIQSALLHFKEAELNLRRPCCVMNVSKKGYAAAKRSTLALQ